MTTTARQEVVLVMYYRLGMRHSQIGEALGISSQASYSLVQRGTRTLIRLIEEEGVDGTLLVEAMFADSETSSSTTHVGRAISRQEELADALALRLEQREAELAMYEQWLDGDSHLPTHVKRNDFDQWELRLLQGRHRESLPTSAYDCEKAAASCAMNGTPCTVRPRCIGCRQQG